MASGQCALRAVSTDLVSGSVELSVLAFAAVRDDVEVCWWLRLGAGCMVCRCTVDVDVGGGPQEFKGPGIPMANPFERGCNERFADVSGNAVVSGGCQCMTRLSGVDGCVGAVHPVGGEHGFGFVVYRIIYFSVLGSA